MSTFGKGRQCIEMVCEGDRVAYETGVEYGCGMLQAVGTRSGRSVESGSDMQAAPARYVSVSELYSTDEVELLLDEIRELEPTSCRGEDVQVLQSVLL